MEFDFDTVDVRAVTVLKLTVNEITGKRLRVIINGIDDGAVKTAPVFEFIILNPPKHS